MGRVTATAKAAVASTMQRVPPGGVAVLRWEPMAPREIIMRPCTEGDESQSHWEWSAPISPVNLGDAFIKLFSIDRLDTDYLCLTVTMKGSQRMLEVLSTSGDVSLPYRLTNESNFLIALRQQGSMRPHWDLLGAGETCEYALDEPSRPHVLHVLARSAAGDWAADSSRALAVEGNTNAGLSLERLEELTTIEMEPHATDVEMAQLVELPMVARAGRSEVRAPMTGLPRDEVIIVSAGCDILLSDGAP